MFSFLFLINIFVLHAEEVPKRLLQLHQSSIAEAQCTDLKEQLQTQKIISWLVDDYTKMHALPCATWGHNQSWKIYVEFNEPQKDGHGLFKRLMFTAFDWDGSLSASDVVHMWKWNAETKRLTSLFMREGRLDCGSQYEYAWHDGYLKFQLKRALFKPTCDGNTNWPEVSLPK